MTRQSKVYTVYSGQGYCARIIYRVDDIGYIEFHCGNFWQWSGISINYLKSRFPLVAKNVRFKA